MKVLATIAGILCIVVALSGCDSPQEASSAADATAASDSGGWEPEISKSSPSAKAYKSDLIAAIERADRIVLVEHSTPFDYVDKETGETDRLPSAIYGTVRLSAAQRKTFVASIREVPDETPNWGLACVFDAHHSIFFYSKAALTSRMDVCFHCGEVKWGGSRHSPPLNLTDGLAAVVKAAGLSPEREWRHILAAYRANGSSK